MSAIQDRRTSVRLCMSQNSVDSEESSDSMNDISAPFVGIGICKEKPMTDAGKRVQLIKMLCLTVLPILGLWAFSVFILTDTIHKKTENEKTKQELKLSLELGNLIHRLQQERDMSVLYLSALGPETKTFLLQEYIGTDNAVDKISNWPSNLDQLKREEFASKDSLRDYLVRHRQLLTKAMYDIQEEIDFYTNIIQVVITWLYKSITHGKNAEVWKTLVAYLKLTSGKQDVGIERALGTLFFVQGGFKSSLYFEMYNNVIHTFRAFYTTAELYSSRVDRLYTSGVNEVGGDLIGIINEFRFVIQHHEGTTGARDIQRARYWFDNMTLYLDTLLEIQQDLGYEIIGKVDVVILDSIQELSISTTFLVIVLIMCPLVIFCTENLTSSIQKHALALIYQTKELSAEQKRNKSLMYLMLPKSVVDRLDTSKSMDAEYFKSASVLFVAICNLDKIVKTSNLSIVLDLMGYMCSAIDCIIQKYDVHKLDTARDRFMIISGITTRTKTQHVTEIADIALELLQVMNKSPYILPAYGKIKIQMGIHTGPCMAGIVGKSKPRYYLFGNTVEHAAKLMARSKPNHILIGWATNTFLQQTASYNIRKNGSGGVKKDKAKSYWLKGKISDDSSIGYENDEDLTGYHSEECLNSELPGEIVQYNDSLLRTALTVPLPGRSITNVSKKRNVGASNKAVLSDVPREEMEKETIRQNKSSDEEEYAGKEKNDCIESEEEVLAETSEHRKECGIVHM